METSAAAPKRHVYLTLALLVNYSIVAYPTHYQDIVIPPQQTISPQFAVDAETQEERGQGRQDPDGIVEFRPISWRAHMP